MKKGGVHARIRSTKEAVKVHNYYTVPARGGGRPEINNARRGGRAPLKKIDLQSLSQKTIKYLVFVLILVGGLYTLRLSPNPVVVINSDTQLGRSEEYIRGIRSILDSSALYQTKLTFNEEKFVSELEKTYPEIASLTLSIPFLGNRPVVHIREAALPFLLDSNGITYAVNDSGVVVGEADEFNVTGRRLSIRDESGVEVSRGSRILRSDDAEFFARVEEILASKGRELTTIRITSIPREATVAVKDLPYVLRLYLDESADTQIATFFSAEKTLEGRGEQPMVYMDLRAGEKVYWQ